MYINHNYKVGFVHNPKTGGSALLKALPFLGLDGPKHGKSIKLPSNYFIFSFVRNPYQRLVSYYRFQIHKRPERVNYDWYKDFYSFITIETNKYIIKQSDLITPELNIYQYEELEEAHKHICNKLNCKYVSLARNENTLYFGDYDWKQYMTKEALEFINDFCDAE